MPITVEFFDENGESLGKMEAAPKDFKTGSRGFFSQGKIARKDGKRYQVQVQMVEIGSKPPAK